MASNLEKYKTEIESLGRRGDFLRLAMQRECHRKDFDELYKKVAKTAEKFKEFVEELPVFSTEYQKWYSESLAVIKQLIPDRLSDFIRLYEKPKTRKNIEYGNYVIEDYLQGMQVTRFSGTEVVVGKAAAIPQFEQQLHMSRSIGGGGTDPLLLVAVLVVGAMLYTRSARTAQAATPGRTVYVPGSMAGSSGSGAAQVAGGILGGVMDWFKSSNGTSGLGLPDTYNASPATGGLNSWGLPGDIGGSLDDPAYG